MKFSLPSSYKTIGCLSVYCVISVSRCVVTFAVSNPHNPSPSFLGRETIVTIKDAYFVVLSTHFINQLVQFHKCKEITNAHAYVCADLGYTSARVSMCI